MTKFLNFFLLFVFIANCSLDTKSNIWTKNKKIVKEKQKTIKLLFKDEKPLDTEFNPNFKSCY